MRFTLLVFSVVVMQCCWGLLYIHLVARLSVCSFVTALFG